MSALSLLVDSWRNRHRLGDGAARQELAAFLPAALEIQETPPNPLARRVAWSLLLLFVLFLLWSLFGRVDIVASAEGKIIPSARVKHIQPLAKAVVKRILVSEGQFVEQGQPLIELDSTLTAADQQRLQGELDSARLQQAVARAFLQRLDADAKALDGQTDLPASPELPPQQTELHRQWLEQQWRDYRARLRAQDSAIEKIRAEQAMTRAVIAKLEQTLPLVTRRVKSLENMYQKAFAAESDYLQLEQERIRQSQDLEAEKQRLRQLAATLAQARQERTAFIARTRAGQLKTLAETTRQIDALQEELTKARDLNARKLLKAPVSGFVQELVVTTVGGVVTDAQQLMTIVPDQAQLEVEAVLQNRDIGFVHPGMPAEIKIHTFPFTKYGVIEGEVTAVSADAIADEQRGLVYRMRLRMQRDRIRVNGQSVQLIPGMAVTAEVKTGQRRIIEFFLAPLLRHGQESIRER